MATVSVFGIVGSRSEAGVSQTVVSGAGVRSVLGRSGSISKQAAAQSVTSAVTRSVFGIAGSVAKMAATQSVATGAVRLVSSLTGSISKMAASQSVTNINFLVSGLTGSVSKVNAAQSVLTPVQPPPGMLILTMDNVTGVVVTG